MTTVVRIEQVEPLSGARALQLATEEYAALAAQLQDLDPADWTKPTDCPQWDVRAVAGHCVGMMTDFSSLGSVMRRMRAASKVAKANGVEMVDAMTAGQVADQASLGVDALITCLVERGPLTARWRARAPRLFRMMPIKEHVGGRPETWRMRYLLDTVLTRDPWMHRVDIARATGRGPVLTPVHDGVLVADAVAEWARRHGQPCTLTLTGPAGGEFVAGDGSGEAITLDAVEFCRTISGRATGHGLLTQEVPF
jgi:uncharacterized protein (TIGR03083 family)